MTQLSSITDAETTGLLSLCSEGDAEVIHIHPALWMVRFPLSWNGEFAEESNPLSSCRFLSALSCFYFCLQLPQEHMLFFNSVRQWSGQPRSLQHLCRCALRHHFGAQCHSAVCKLDIPGSVRDYLLLCDNKALQWITILSYLAILCLPILKPVIIQIQIVIHVLKTHIKAVR